MAETLLLGKRPGSRGTGTRTRRRRGSSYTKELGMDELKNTSVLSSGISLRRGDWRSKKSINRDGSSKLVLLDNYSSSSSKRLLKQAR